MAGYAWMAVAVLIWASWLVLTSSGRTTALSIVDLAGFRALIPTFILAPLLWRQRRNIAQLGVTRCLLLSAYGAPFTLCVGYGLTYAPVAHAGAMVPGLMPVFAAALSYVFLGQRLSPRQVISVLLIQSGALAILLRTSAASGAGEMWVGHLLFLMGALCWACFTTTVIALDISPYLATSIVGGVSSVGLIPIWALLDLSTLGSAHPADILFQAVFQGIFSGLVSLFAFGQALRLIGTNATALSALTPGVATVLAIPVLGQVPDLIDFSALTLVVAGLVTGSSNKGGGLGRLPADPKKSQSA
ncbi:DMT family transporter [Roseobacter sp. EG26]|uniref:DMT family transporter n=1 Tax=Roseobacter sp. EG26 TaxID=3412477 RepID=UPI003CE451FC